VSGYSSDFIGWQPNFAGNRPPGNCACVNCCLWCACFCLCCFSARVSNAVGLLW